MSWMGEVYVRICSIDWPRVIFGFSLSISFFVFSICKGSRNLLKSIDWKIQIRKDKRKTWNSIISLFSLVALWHNRCWHIRKLKMVLLRFFFVSMIMRKRKKDKKIIIWYVNISTIFMSTFANRKSFFCLLFVLLLLLLRERPIESLHSFAYVRHFTLSCVCLLFIACVV